MEVKKCTNVDEFILHVNTEYKVNMLARGESSKMVMNVNRFSSGILSLDEALGGGWPYTRVALLAGDFSTGKTEIALRAMESIQNYDRVTKKHKLLLPEGSPFTPGRVLYVDAENAFDTVWAKSKGIDIDYHVMCRPDTGNQVVDIVTQAIGEGLFELVIIDSLAQCIPMEELSESSVVGDTLITIKQGGRIHHRRIDSLVNCKNLEALSFDGNRLVWKPISKVWKCDKPRTTITLKTKYGKSVEITEDHSIYIVEKGTTYKDTDNTKVRRGVVKCVQGSEVKVGDHLFLTGCLNEDTVTHVDMSQYQNISIESPYNKCHTGLPVEVLEITKNEVLQPVYDMSVPGTENFVGNGLLVHNSEDWQMGLAARLNNKAFRKWNATLALRSRDKKGGPLLLVLNQMRMKIGTYFGDPRVLPGGQGQLYCSSIIIYTRSSKYDDKDAAAMAAVEMGGVVFKNKTFIPKQNYTMKMGLKNTEDLVFGEIDNANQLVKRGTEVGFIVKSKGVGYELFGVNFPTKEAILGALKTTPLLKLKLWRSIVHHVTGADT